MATFTSADTICLMQILAAAFVAILFLQSGIDKVVDRRGNLEWLKGHFAKSPLTGTVPALLTAITILELAAGVLSALGCVLLLVLRDPTFALCGAFISVAVIISLFVGQRIAREYRGAGILVPYFLLAVLQVYLVA